MEEMTINFFDKVKNPARISMDNREINFNMTEMCIMAAEQDMTFNETFGMCVSHELIHQILFEFISAYAYDTFDNICFNKYKNMKHWIGGIGGK